MPGWLEAAFGTVPLSILEVWGRFGYLLGILLAVAAFGGFTFRPGGRWGFGRERQAWDAKALLSSALTFVLIFVTGYIGSFIVLVPGAQTFESLKDLSVFVCILLFGYPALIIVPVAYGLSDLIEGVPPGFLLDWWAGYFINPACFWIAYQFIGRNPDFRRAKTWSWYVLFVAIFMSLEPQLWGYICSGKFTTEISYRVITPALFFTTSVTWIIAPFAMLGALPLARRYGMFWPEIAGRDAVDDTHGLPVRVFLAAPVIALVLIMVGTVAYLTVRSGEVAANTLASRLHREISDNINLKLDVYLEKAGKVDDAERARAIDSLLRATEIAEHGSAFIIDLDGRLIASSNAGSPGDPVVTNATSNLVQRVGSLRSLQAPMQFTFDIVSAKPLTRETWLAQATPYHDNSGLIDWVEVTAIPPKFYLSGVLAGNSRAAMVFAVALIFSLLLAVLLAGVLTNPIRRISRSAEAMARGDLAQRVPAAGLLELSILAQSFNHMAGQLQDSFTRTASSESRLRAILDSTLDAVVILDARGRLVDLNPAAERHFGYPSAAAVGMPIAEFVNLPAQAQWNAGGLVLGQRVETSAWRRDGLAFPVELCVQQIGAEAPPLFAAIIQDLTERKRLEEQFVQAQKMETVGQMAGGIAHDFNNLLTVINSSAELAAMALREGDPLLDKLSTISDAGSRAAVLTRHLLAFSRKQVLQPAVMNLNTIVEKLQRVLRRVITENIELRIVAGSNLDNVNVDPGQMEQVILNLAVNSRDAMPDGGTLTIATRQVMVDAAFAQAHPGMQAGLYVVLAVSDTGAGMDQATLRRMFEPFFTTKGVGQGTGLGLATVHGIIKQSGGDVHVVSEVGRGTTIEMFLPAVADEATVEQQAPAAMAARGTETILLVDDDADICDVVKEMLEGAGYRVIAASRTGDALAMLAREARPPDLLLTDMVMPDMSGPQLAARVRGVHPLIKVLYASGYTESTIANDGALMRGVQFIGKPYTVSELTHKVRKVLDEPSGQLLPI